MPPPHEPAASQSQVPAIDDCTRIRVLKVYDACNQRTAIEFIDDVLRRLPFRVHVIQTDNGAECQPRFHGHLEDRDIRHVYIREDYYKYHRPHGALAGQTPYERLLAKARAGTSPAS